MRVKTTLLYCLFLLLAGSTYAQKFKYAYYQGDEVPFTKVNQMIQDFKGFAWLATDQGLFRFDGNTFEDFNTTLRSKTIRAFVPWGENSLLFTNDTGIHQISYIDTQAQIGSFETNINLHYPTGLYRDSQNRLWVGQMNGAIAMFPKNQNQAKLFEPVSSEKVNTIFFEEDKFGTIWALVPGHGLFYFDEKPQEFQPFKNYGSSTHFLIEEDVIWMVGEQLEKFRITRNRNISDRKIFSVNKKFRRITKNEKGVLFLSSESAIFTLQNETNQVRLSKVFGANDPHRVEELSFGAINHVQFTEDETGLDDMVWVCSDKGLALLWSGFFQSVSGLGHDNIRAMNSTQEGPILISQGAVSRIQNNGLVTSSHKVDDLNGIVGIASSGNHIWYGSEDGNIWHYQDRQLIRKHYLNERGSGVFFLMSDHTRDLWFCQAASNKPIIGAAKINSKGEIIEYGKDKGFDNRVLVIREGGKNELYAAGIGVSSYLYKYDRLADRFQNKSLPFTFKVSGNFEVHDMAVDHLGIVWLATTDGLLKYDTETIRKVDLGIYTHNEVRSITAMPDGTIWLATDTNGLIHLDAHGKYVVFDEASGTPSKISAYRCMVFYGDSQLWVGTPEGVVYSTHATSGPYQTKTPLVKQVTIDNNEVEEKSGIQFKESQTLTLSMATLTFPSEDIRYQFKIFNSDLLQEDIDDLPWSEVQTSNLTIKDIEGGDYQVWVRGQKPGGFGWSQPVAITLDVAKKWYRTWWGIVVLIALGFFFFWFFAKRWLLKRVGRLQNSLHQKQRELQKKEAELVVQTSTLQDKKNELKSTGANIYLLQRLMRQIPKQSSWKIVLPILGKLVELPTGIDVFEIALKKGEAIHYKGYQRGNHQLMKREEAFDEKSNLASYVIVTEKNLLINDYDKEIEEYISKKDSDGYVSRMYVPFEQSAGGMLVFCAYSKDKNAFSQQIPVLVGILVQFLSINPVDELK